MKVLEVLDCYYPSLDGPIICVNNYCKNFIKNGEVAPTILVPKYPKYKDSEDFEIRRVTSMRAMEGYRVALPQLDRGLKKFIKNGNFDLIHVHSPFTLGRYALKIGKKLNIPTMLTMHTFYDRDINLRVKFKPFCKIAMKYIVSTMNKADVVLTVSENAKEHIKAFGYKKDIEVITNGTDLKYPENAEELKQKIYKTYHLSKDDNIFIYCGRIVENKNIQQSIKALKLVKDAGYDFKFLIIGEGNYLSDLKVLAKELGLENNVIFAGRINDRELLSAHYLVGDLFLFPSTFDSFGLVVLEAATMKLPSLLINGSAAGEKVTDGVDGLLAEDTPESIGNKILSLLKDKSQLTSIKENCYNNLYYSWEQVVNIVEKRYKTLQQDYAKNMLKLREAQLNKKKRPSKILTRKANNNQLS